MTACGPIAAGRKQKFRTRPPVHRPMQRVCKRALRTHFPLAAGDARRRPIGAAMPAPRPRPSIHSGATAGRPPPAPRNRHSYRKNEAVSHHIPRPRPNKLSPTGTTGVRPTCSTAVAITGEITRAAMKASRPVHQVPRPKTGRAKAAPIRHIATVAPTDSSGL